MMLNAVLQIVSVLNLIPWDDKDVSLLAALPLNMHSYTVYDLLTTMFPCADQTCPLVQSSNAENCVGGCSSDDDCEGSRICCSNGCGGYTCSDTVETCEVRL